MFGASNNMINQQTIFTVKIKAKSVISAELEINKSEIKCITGETVNFVITRENFRSFLHLVKGKIILNFIYDNELYVVTIISKHSSKIIESLNVFIQK